MSALFDNYQQELLKKFQDYKLVPKEESKLMKIMYYGLLMNLWSPTFMTKFTTVLGYTVYMPSAIIGTDQGYQILRHEAVHMERYSWMGLVYYFLYLFVLPTVWTYRAEFEFEAYVESLRVEYEMTGTISNYTIDWMVDTFASPNYLWMCPFKEKMRAKFLAAKDKIVAEGVPTV